MNIYNQIVSIVLLLPLNFYLMRDNPYSQHYTLKQDTPVWFYIPDQLCWTRGKTIYLWGYYPMISSSYGLIEFNNVIWEIGND